MKFEPELIQGRADVFCARRRWSSLTVTFISSTLKCLVTYWTAASFLWPPPSCSSIADILNQLSSVQWNALYHSLVGKTQETRSPRTKVEEQAKAFTNSKNNVMWMLSYIVGDNVVGFPIKMFALYYMVILVGSRYSHCCLHSGLVLSQFYRRVTTTSYGPAQPT